MCETEFVYVDRYWFVLCAEETRVLVPINILCTRAALRCRRSDAQRFRNAKILPRDGYAELFSCTRAIIPRRYCFLRAAAWKQKQNTGCGVHGTPIHAAIDLCCRFKCTWLFLHSPTCRFTRFSSTPVHDGTRWKFSVRRTPLFARRNVPRRVVYGRLQPPCVVQKAPCPVQISIPVIIVTRRRSDAGDFPARAFNTRRL